MIFVTFLTKLRGPTPVTYLGWCMVRCGYKNRHQKDMCLKEIMDVQNLLTILDLIVNIIGGLCDQDLLIFISI